MSKPNTVLTMTRSVEQFIAPDRMDELRSVVNLTTPDEIPKDEDGYAKFLKDHEAEIAITGWGSPKLTVKAYEANPQLKYMAHMTGTVRGMLEKECIERGLLVTNWGNLIGPTVAEGALMGILSCLRRTTKVAFRTHQEKGWRDGAEKDVQSLFYRKVGLHGFGIIAQNLVELMAPFKCELSTYSPHAPDEALEKFGVRRINDLKSLYAENHIVSIHASNTPENRHIVNAEILAGMHDGGVVVNTARGAIIDDSALVAELKKERLYASLDVYDPEPPPPDSPYRGLLNCQMTCHTAGPTPDRMVDFGAAAIENVKKYVKGEEVERIVDARKYDLIT